MDAIIWHGTTEATRHQLGRRRFEADPHSGNEGHVDRCIQARREICRNPECCLPGCASDLEKAKRVIALEKLFQQEMTEEEEEDVQELDEGDDEGLELVCEGFAAEYGT